MRSKTLRTLLATFAVVTAIGAAGIASAREFDPSMDPNTSLSPLPMHATSASMRINARMKKEPATQAKYDLAFPVRDRAPVRHYAGSI